MIYYDSALYLEIVMRQIREKSEQQKKIEHTLCLESNPYPVLPRPTPSTLIVVDALDFQRRDSHGLFKLANDGGGHTSLRPGVIVNLFFFNSISQWR